MRYLSVAEAVAIAEAVTGIPAETLIRSESLGLLDSALHALMAAFGDEEFYPSFLEKAAVLAVRVVRNHPLPDGNERLGWAALRMFCVLNSRRLEVTTIEAVDLMLGVASGDLDEQDVTRWLADHVDQDQDEVGGS